MSGGKPVTPRSFVSTCPSMYKISLFEARPLLVLVAYIFAYNDGAVWYRR